MSIIKLKLGSTKNKARSNFTLIYVDGGHKQCIANVKAGTTSERASIQPTLLVPSYGGQVLTCLEEGQLKYISHHVVGLIFSRITQTNNNVQVFAQVVLNIATYQYQLNGILLERHSQLPVRIKSAAGRKRLCRYLNQQNSFLIYGAYSVHPETGGIKFKISPTQTKQQFKAMIENNEKFNRIVREDLEILKMRIESYSELIYKVYTEERQQDSLLKHQSVGWLAEVLPMMNQSTPSIELDADTNKEPLKQPKILEGHIIQSEESFRQRCEELSANRRRVTDARDSLEVYLPNQQKHLSMEETAKLRSKFIQSSNLSKYKEMFQKPKQSVAQDKDNINICASIVLKQIMQAEQEWKSFVRTGTFEWLFRKKLQFIYGDYQDLQIYKQKAKTTEDENKYQPTEVEEQRKKRQKDRLPLSNGEKHKKEEGETITQPISSKLVTLKNPIFPRKGGKPTALRQAEFVKIMQNSECSNIAKYYRTNSTGYLQGRIEVAYKNCVLMDYYTYKSTDNFVVTNCKTNSSLSLLSILVQTLTAMRFMKNSCITHCDLKPSNVLIGKGLQAKVADFGQAHVPLTQQTRKLTEIQPEDMDRHIPGYTLPYSPPELFIRGELNFARQGHKFDVFSFGVMMMELLFEMFPVEQRKKEPVCHDKLIDALRSRTYMNLVLCNVERLYYCMSGEISEILCSVALKCLDPDPSLRPCVDWLLIIMKGLHTYIEKTCS